MKLPWWKPGETMEEPIERTEQEQMSSVEQDPYQTLQDHYHILLSLYRILEKDQGLSISKSSQIW